MKILTKSYNFDYIIIGSGPAGRAEALRLAKAKKKVAIVEKSQIGGAEITTYELPFKLALDFARIYHDFTTSPVTKNISTHFNFPTLTTYLKKEISKESAKLKSDLEASGIKIIEGFAHFLDQNTIAVGDKKITADKFILATGSKLKPNKIPGLDDIKYITPENIFKIRKLPRFVFVIGNTTVSKCIAEFFENLGVGVIRSAKVLEVKEDKKSKIVYFMDDAGKKMVRVDAIALATGSEPFLDYSLENANVEFKRSGIIVDKHSKTSTRNIYAVGDCASVS
ncbi:NAD(P)/FAD-dependent oxidoreductase [Candidatus Saccharibacteria bacterium]|nr:NAD(P)/FAD-dependent oxidoreductase [Candidatus Saccharibacteria bacterium]